LLFLKVCVYENELVYSGLFQGQVCLPDDCFVGHCGSMRFCAAMLLARFGERKRKAYGIQCISNSNKLGVALQMYLDDHQDPCPDSLGRRARELDNSADDELIYYIANLFGVSTRQQPK